MALNSHVDRIAALFLVALTLAFTRPASVSGDGVDAVRQAGGNVGPDGAGSPFRINRTFLANGTNIDQATFPPLPPTTTPLIL